MQIHANGLNLYAQMIEVRKALNETTASFWSDLEIFNALNQGQAYIARKSTPIKKKVTITTVNGTQEYDLKDNGFPDIIDISDDGVDFKVGGSVYVPLDYTSKKQLSLERRGWRSVNAATPQQYYYDKPSKTIGLYPKPNSTNAGAYLDINGYYVPPILNAGTVAGATSTTLVMPDGSATLQYPSATNDYYNGLYVEIYSGIGAGQRVKITDYVASTRTCTLAWTTTPTSSSIYGMVSPIEEAAHYLMPLYALSVHFRKGGTRTTLGDYYWKAFLSGLALFIGEVEDNPDESLVKESYRT